MQIDILYSETVKTNVGAKFLILIDRHFKNSPLHRYFNRRSIKVSYSCLPNVSSIISGHNRKVIQENEKKKLDEVRKCNCQTGTSNCPLQGNCLQKEIIYKATVKTSTEEKTYIGQAGNTFKERYGDHKSSISHKIYESKTALSKHIWKVKENKLDFDLQWQKVAGASTYRPEMGKCNLCNLEKTIILYANDTHLLNKKSELMNKCRHRNKHLLAAISKGTARKRNFLK